MSEHWLEELGRMKAEAASDEGLKMPVFKCREIRLPCGTKAWTFWCPICEKDHIHSAAAGHRVAHCADNFVMGDRVVKLESPFRNTGYCLILDNGHQGNPPQGS